MRKQRDPAFTKAALLTAGMDLFAERGYEGATVGLIARRARVNPAMISYHFGGKKKLYHAILNETFSRAVAPVREIRESGQSAEDRLRAFIEVFHTIVLARPSFPMLIVREAISGGKHLDRKMLPRFLDIFQLVREIVEQGMKEGRFRTVQPALTHIGLIGSLVFFFATGSFRDRIVRELGVPAGTFDPAAFVRHTEELILRGLSAGAPAAPWRKP